MFDTNVFGLFDMVTAFTPLLLAAVHTPTSKSTKQQQPTIINIASIVSRIPLPFAAAYNASKAGVSAYSDTLRLELAPLGIRVVTVFMGEVATKLRSADMIDFGPESLYADVEGKLKERIEHGTRVSIAPEVFAREVVDKVLVQGGSGGGGRASYIWKGTNAFLVWFLNAVGPRKVFDSIMKGFVGFDDKGLVKLIYERGRQAVAAGKVDGDGQ
jgi:NAD(P)-dependent dehydrogenase (short-subunit alcohol dehydrogenase family)